MSAHQNSPNSNPDEIDLGQLFAVINSWIKQVIRTIFSVFTFFRQRVLLFLGLVLFGSIAGYYWDSRPSSKRYKKEIKIEPNFGSTDYIYDFVKQFNQSFRDPKYRESLGIKKEQFKYLIGVQISPVLDYINVLDYFEKNYGNSKAYEIFVDNSVGLEDFVKYYRLHNLQLSFKGEKGLEHNQEDSQAFISLLKTNSYFTDRQDFQKKQLRKNLEEMDKTLIYINDYISKISKNRSLGSNAPETILMATESEIPTVTSLLKQKQSLLDKKNKAMESLHLKAKLISIVNDGEITEDPSIFNKKMLLFPALLVVLTSLFFFFTFLLKSVKHYIGIGA